MNENKLVQYVKGNTNSNLGQIERGLGWNRYRVGAGILSNVKPVYAV
jgi:hypothetical protein